MRMTNTTNADNIKYQPLDWGTRTLLFGAVIAPVALVLIVLGFLKFIAAI